jgi:hypothetical protein
MSAAPPGNIFVKNDVLPMTDDKGINAFIPDRVVLIPVLGIIVFLLIAGCIGPGNPANLSSPQNTSKSLLVHTPCLTSKNATPYIHINPIGFYHHTGEVFEINGTTNFCTTTHIFFRVYQLRPLSVAPAPGPTFEPSNYTLSGTSGNASITEGKSGINNWSYSVNLSGFNDGSYSVNVWNYYDAVWGYSNQTVQASVGLQIEP